MSNKADYIFKLANETVRDNRSDATDFIAESITNSCAYALINALDNATNDNLLALGRAVMNAVTQELKSSEGYKEFLNE